MVSNKSVILLIIQHYSGKKNKYESCLVLTLICKYVGPEIDLHLQSNSVQSSGLLLHKFYEYSSSAPIL